MANPYPMQPMQPMQPMPPMGQMPSGPVVRRGTSKAVPVVVSAGLAIGVFCGLLFGLGIPEKEATADSTETASTEKDTTPSDDVAEPFQPERKKVDLPTTAGSGSAAAGSGSAGAGSGSAGAGSGSAGAGSATAPKPVKAIGRLKVVVKPEAIASKAKIYVDDKELEGDQYEIDLTDQLDKTKHEARKSVTVTIKAPGYKEYEQKVDIIAVPDQEEPTSFEVELIRRRPAVRPPRRPPPPGKNPKCRKPPCGLIDI